MLSTLLAATIYGFLGASEKPVLIAQVPKMDARPTPNPAQVLPVAVPSKPIPPFPTAALRWVSPEPETTAAPQEEIPLQLEAESTTGLRQFVLHVVLNGEPRAPIPLPEIASDGVQTLSIALHLEPLETQSYDVVSYYMTAERVRPSDFPLEPVWPVISSALQFVEIRVGREDLTYDTDQDGDAGRVLQQIQELKFDQLHAYRDTFALDHGLPARADPEWSGLVRGAQAHQRSVVEKTSDVTSAALAARVPAEAGAALNAAKSEAEKATAELMHSDVTAATAPGGRGLAHIAAAEKVVAGVVSEHRAKLAAEAAEEAARLAKEEDETKLPPREKSPAGRLEKLADEQKALADLLAEHGATGDTFADEDRISRALEKLAAEQTLSSEVTAGVQSGAGGAKEAASQLNEQDAAAAIEPATHAAQALAEAVAKLDAAGRAQAAHELELAQLVLIRASSDVRGLASDEIGDQTENARRQTAALREALRTVAFHQQERGSAEGAQQLAGMAAAIDQSKVKQALKEISAPPGGDQAKQREETAQTLTRLAQQAVDARAALDDRNKMQAKALEELERAHANLQRAAREGSTATRDIYERALASAQLAGTKEEANTLPPPPTIELPPRRPQTGPLRWRYPDEQITAARDRTLDLEAEAHTATGLAHIALQVSVNGKPRPPMPVGDAQPGVQRVLKTLSLADFNVRDGDIVSYLFTAEPIAAKNERGAASVSSTLQFIGIRGFDENSREGDEAGRFDEKFTQFVQSMLAFQRAVIASTTALARGEPPTSEAASPAARSVIEAEKSAREAIGQYLKEHASDLSRKNRGLFRVAADDMQQAVVSLARTDATGALPPETHALGALMRILNSPQSNLDGSASAANSQPEPGGARAHRVPGGGLQLTGVLKDYASQLAPRIDGLINLATEAARAAKRSHVLATGNPVEAPPVYRPAVADYFESLARERPAAPPRKP